MNGDCFRIFSRLRRLQREWPAMGFDAGPQSDDDVSAAGGTPGTGGAPENFSTIANILAHNAGIRAGEIIAPRCCCLFGEREPSGQLVAVDSDQAVSRYSKGKLQMIIT